nr:hypothetical protein [Rhodococcus sp. (in: high G+C Gram-positive bacteria)]
MRDGDDEAWDVVESLCVTVDRVREQLMNTQESLRRLMRHLDDTADGLGDWHDGTEYVEWARSEVQKIYATVVKSGVLE